MEGSAFNGREPDENRWGFEPMRLDSYSGRVTVNPTMNWSLTAGYGFIHSPDAMFPTEDVHRVTASALYGRPIATNGEWSSAVIWGANSFRGRPALSQSLLVETDAILDASNTVFARTEFVQKSAEDLAVAGSSGNFSPATIFNVGSLSVGYIRELTQWFGVSVGLGGMGTMNVVPSTLKPSYGSRTPAAGLLFLRLRASRERAMNSGMGDMKMN